MKTEFGLRDKNSAKENLAVPAEDSSDEIRVSRRNETFHHFRYVVIILGGFVMGTMMFNRISITVSIISMVNRTALFIREHPNGTSEERMDFFPEDYVETGVFEWTNEIQQTIISGYMVAYTLPQLFTTRLSMRHGLRWSIWASLMLCAISNILTPWLSYQGWQFTLLLRLTNALGASAILPSMINAIESWFPYKDTAKGVTLFQFVHTSIFALCPLMSGYLTSIHWRWAFYGPAMVGVVVATLWLMLSSDGPRSSSFVSQRELDLIEGREQSACLGEEKQNSADSKKPQGKVAQRYDLPWYFTLKIRNFYYLALVWSLYCSSVGGFLFLLPSYMNRVLQIPIEEIGLQNFYVQIGTMFCMLWPHPMGKYLEKRFNMSLTATRILSVFICELFVCLTFGYLALFHENLVLTIFINRFFHMTNDTIVLATVMSQFGHLGLSGLMYSSVNTIGNLLTVLFSWAAGRFLDYTGETLQCWSWVFVVIIVLNVLYTIIYAITCPSEKVHVDMPERKGGPA